MIVLDSATKRLEVVLGGAVAATQAAIVASWVDVTPTTYVSGSRDLLTNSGTAVTAVYGIQSGQRQIKFLSIFNDDSAAIAVTVRIDNNGTARKILTVTLAVDSTLFYTDGEGFRVMDTTGAIL